MCVTENKFNIKFYIKCFIKFEAVYDSLHQSKNLLTLPY
jgi:hypothetical protein